MKNTTWMKDGVFAHRGLHNDMFPENTKAAFKNALDHGFNIELDVQLTKDNKLVVVHDKNLKRLTGTSIDIDTSMYDQIKDLKVRNSEHNIPLLQEILDMVPADRTVLVELKSSVRNKALVDSVLKVMHKYQFTYAFLSFDPRIVRILKKHYPTKIRGFIRKYKHSKFFLFNWLIRLLPVIKYTDPDFIMHKRVDLPNRKMNLFVKEKPVLAYTCMTEEDLMYIKKIYTNAVFEGFIPTKKDID